METHYRKEFNLELIPLSPNHTPLSLVQ